MIRVVCFVIAECFIKGENMLSIEYKNGFYPIKLLKATKEKEGIIHSFFGSDCCKSQLLKDFKCSKCGKQCLSIKIDLEEKLQTGSQDLWSLTEIPFSEIELATIKEWYWIAKGELKQPSIKGRDMEKLNQFKDQMQRKKELKDLFLELVNDKKALRGNIIFRAGKVNQCVILPYIRNGISTLALGKIDTNLELVTPQEKYEPIVIKSEL